MARSRPSLIAESERAGLLARRQEHGSGGHSYHPLVRSSSRPALSAKSATDARSAAPSGGRLGRVPRLAYRLFPLHAAGDLADLHRVLSASSRASLRRANVALANEYLARFPPGRRTSSTFEIVRSRLAASRATSSRPLAITPCTPSKSIRSQMRPKGTCSGPHAAGDLLARATSPLGWPPGAVISSSRGRRRVTDAILDVTLDGNLDHALVALERAERRNRQGRPTVTMKV